MQTTPCKGIIIIPFLCTCPPTSMQCDSQAPQCSNCHRRSERCQYPSWDTPPRTTIYENPRVTSGISKCHRAASVSTLTAFFELIRNPELQDTLWICGPSESELSLWIQTLNSPASSSPYLQHGLYSLLSLHDPEPKNRSLAYKHYLAASKLFREAPPTVNEDNWATVLIFAISVLIFHFATQQSCVANEFDYIETFHVLRMTVNLAPAITPFLFRSDVWPFIRGRVQLLSKPLDVAMQTAIENLESVIVTSIPSNDDNWNVCLQALNALRDWAAECDGYPRTWRHYIHWAGNVSEKFLALLVDEDDIALLILIHWCAILDMGPTRWFLKSWPRRTAASAFSRLTVNWEDLLTWPAAILGSSLVSGSQTSPP